MRGLEGFSQTAVAGSSPVPFALKRGGLFVIEFTGTSGSMTLQKFGADGVTLVTVGNIVGNPVSNGALGTPTPYFTAYMPAGSYQVTCGAVVGGLINVCPVPAGD